MKIGMHRIPHTTLKRPALIWYNKQDSDLQEAFTALNSNLQGIKQLVIVTKPRQADYNTKQLISWFMSQSFDRNVRLTTTATNPMKAFKPKRTRRNYVDQLVIKIDYTGQRIANQPKDYFRMYIMTPQMHIFPSNFRDQTQTNNTYLMVDSWGVGYASAESDYAYYKDVMEMIATPWSPAVEVKPQVSHKIQDYPLYNPLCQAYELDPEDEHAVEQLDYYIITQEPIVKLPRDEEFYMFCIKLGIAPAFSDIESGTSIYDDQQIEQFGKEAMIDELRNFNDTDLLPDFY